VRGLDPGADDPRICAGPVRLNKFLLVIGHSEHSVAATKHMPKHGRVHMLILGMKEGDADEDKVFQTARKGRLMDQRPVVPIHDAATFTCARSVYRKALRL
jgi:hypothetical protein